MRARAAIDTALGAFVALGLLLLLALSIRTSEREELSVRLEGSRAHVLFAKDPESELTLAPRALRPRVERAGPEGISSIDLLTYRVVYGSRWEREITVPAVLGSTWKEETPWPCAAKLRLLPSFFDDGKADGGDALSIVEAKIRAQFPRTISAGRFTVLRFAAVRSIALTLRPEDGALVAAGDIVLDDDDHDPTTFTIDAAVKLGESDGNLAVSLDRIELTWKGKTRRALLVEIADLVTDVEKIAEKVLRSEIGRILQLVQLPTHALRLDDLGLGDVDASASGNMKLHICSAPRVERDGVTLELGGTFELHGRHEDPAIEGPPKLRGKPAELVFPAPAPPKPGEPPYNIELVASGEAFQQALYLVWQSRAMRLWGQRANVLQTFRDKLQDRLTLELTSIEPRLPPVYVAAHPSCDGVAVRLADVALGELADGRKAIAHADVCSSPRVRDGKLELEGRIVYVAVNCAAWDAGWTFTPCLSDVIPIVRSEGLAGAALPLAIPIPDRLLHISTVRDADVTISDLVADTRGELLHARARAVLTPR